MREINCTSGVWGKMFLKDLSNEALSSKMPVFIALLCLSLLSRGFCGVSSRESSSSDNSAQNVVSLYIPSPSSMEGGGMVTGPVESDALPSSSLCKRSLSLSSWSMIF